MEIKFILINVVLAFVLFVTNGILGTIQYKYRDGIFEYARFSFVSDKEKNFSGNYSQKIINPSIFMAIASAIFQTFGNSEICCTLWLIIPFYWVFFWLKIVIDQKIEFVNFKYESATMILSLVLGLCVNKLFIMSLIDNGETIFISLIQFRDAIWYAIIAYLAASAWKIAKVYFNSSEIIESEKIDKIIEKRYEKFNAQFGNQILRSLNQSNLETIQQKAELLELVYAIMIYEDYNRPWLFRKWERVAKRIFVGTEMSLGVMQVKTKDVISDERSIDLAISKLITAYNADEDDPVGSAIRDYNGSESYCEEIFAISSRLGDLVNCEDLFIGSESCENKI